MLDLTQPDESVNIKPQKDGKPHEGGFPESVMLDRARFSRRSIAYRIPCLSNPTDSGPTRRESVSPAMWPAVKKAWLELLSKMGPSRALPDSLRGAMGIGDRSTCIGNTIRERAVGVSKI